MDIHKFYPLQEPQPEEFDEAFVDTTYNLLKRFGVITQPGIVPAAALYALTGDLRWQALIPQGTEFNLSQGATPLTFNVGPGIAFTRAAVSGVGSPQDPTNPVDLRMERVFISPTAAAQAYDANSPEAVDVLGNALPQSTGCVGVPVSPNRTYYVYVKYLACVDSLAAGTSSENKYSVNPDTGQLQYTHWVDGYRISLFESMALAGPDAVYLGTITTGLSAITSISMSGRTFLSIPGSLVTANMLNSLQPAGYTAGVSGAAYSFTDHINAISSPTDVSRNNPHGTMIEDIPGLLSRFGIYSDFPQYFLTNGIIDTLTSPVSTIPGPFWASVSGARVILRPPVLGQALVVDRYLYDSNSTYYAEAVVEGALELIDSGSDIYCEFQLSPGTLRPAGLYIIYAERAPFVDNPGLAIHALHCGVSSDARLLDVLEKPQNYLTSLFTQYPIAVVNWDPNVGFMLFTKDPQTGYTSTSFYALDTRKYGTIGDWNISHDRRSYNDTLTPNTGNLQRNKTIYSDHIKWVVPGRASVQVLKPIHQTLVKKVGRVRRVVVFSDSIPTGAHLTVDILRNGLGNSIFSVPPRITNGRAGNTPNYSGVANTGVVMNITESAAVAPDEGQLSTVNNYVNPGDRLQLIITTTGTVVPGGNDLMVMVYIE